MKTDKKAYKGDGKYGYQEPMPYESPSEVPHPGKGATMSGSDALYRGAWLENDFDGRAEQYDKYLKEGQKV